MHHFAVVLSTDTSSTGNNVTPTPHLCEKLPLFISSHLFPLDTLWLRAETSDTTGTIPVLLITDPITAPPGLPTDARRSILPL